MNPNNPNPNLRKKEYGTCVLCQQYLSFADVLKLDPIQDDCLMCDCCRVNKQLKSITMKTEMDEDDKRTKAQQDLDEVMDKTILTNGISETIGERVKKWSLFSKIFTYILITLAYFITTLFTICLCLITLRFTKIISALMVLKGLTESLNKTFFEK